MDPLKYIFLEHFEEDCEKIQTTVLPGAPHCNHLKTAGTFITQFEDNYQKKWYILKTRGAISLPIII